MNGSEPLAVDSSEPRAPRNGRPGAGSRLGALLVRSGSRLCAIPLHHVVETLRPLPVESLAGAPPFLRGLAVIRGEAVPVVDLGFLLGAGQAAETGRFVTLTVGDRRIALAVEAVLGLRELDASDLSETPPLLQELDPDLVEAVGALDGQLLLVLRGARLVPEKVWELVLPGRAGGPRDAVEAAHRPTTAVGESA